MISPEKLLINFELIECEMFYTIGSGRQYLFF